jgi:hypothetical protein
VKLNLPKSVASPQDLSALISEVRDYAKWYNHEVIKQRFSGKAHIGGAGGDHPILSAGASEVIRTWFGSKSPNRLGFDALLKELERVTKSARLITVTLAAPTPGSLKATLVGWFRTNISNDILVSFQINSTILGGMVVQYGSHVFDWSFRRNIIANKQNFPEALRHV